MQSKMKLSVLASAMLAGLLLGGNVLADGLPTQTQSSKNEIIAAQIEQIKQQINNLSAQAQAQKNGQTVAPEKTELTPEKLAQIETEVNRIAKETARLKIEVAVFVTLREIKTKTAQLQAQIAAGQTAAPKQTQTAAMTADEQNRAQIEAQIAKIKQQIAELTQEMQTQKTAGQDSIASTADSSECEGESCSLTPSADNATQKITINPATDKPAAQKPAETKSFWQSVGDFFGKIFAF
jgi:chromosome segregation ATPase